MCADPGVHVGRGVGKSAGSERSRRSTSPNFRKCRVPTTPSLMARWERVFSIRDEVLEGRSKKPGTRKQIGSSLEAKVILRPTQRHDAVPDGLLTNNLRYIFIVSQVEVHEGDKLNVEIEKPTARNANAAGTIRPVSGNFLDIRRFASDCHDALKDEVTYTSNQA